MDDRYKIDWQPPNFLPGISLLNQAIQNSRANARADKYAAMEEQAIKNRETREANALKRDVENQKYQRAVQAWAHRKEVFRDASRSPEEGNLNPFGFTFDQQEDAAPSLKESGINVMGGNDQYAHHAARTLREGPSPEYLAAPAENQDEIPTPVAIGQHSGSGQAPMGQHSGGTGYITEADERANIDEQPSPGIEQAQAILNQPRSKHLYATMGGSRFEVPPQSNTTGFGPEYDQMYEHILDADPTMTPINAMKIVAAEHKLAQSQKAIGDRAAAQIRFRNENREDQQTFTAQQNELYKNCLLYTSPS